MLGPEDLVLCCGTVMQADFRQLVEAAAANGYHAISLWPSVYLDAREQGMSDADMKTILDNNGIVIAELDLLCNWIPGRTAPIEDPSMPMTPEQFEFTRTLFTYTEDLQYHISDKLGARHLNIFVHPPAFDTSVAAEAFGGLCDRAAQHDLMVSLEFFPVSPIGDLSKALEIVEMAHRPNGGVMFDTWHHFRNGGTSEDLRKLPGHAVIAIQVNDAAKEPDPDFMSETLTARLLPGDGGIDLIGNIRALDSIGCTAPIGVEIFSSVLDALSPKEAARRAAEATRRVLSVARSEKASP